MVERCCWCVLTQSATSAQYENLSLVVFLAKRSKKHRKRQITCSKKSNWLETIWLLLYVCHVVPKLCVRSFVELIFHLAKVCEVDEPIYLSKCHCYKKHFEQIKIKQILFVETVKIAFFNRLHLYVCFFGNSLPAATTTTILHNTKKEERTRKRKTPLCEIDSFKPNGILKESHRKTCGRLFIICSVFSFVLM